MRNGIFRQTVFQQHAAKIGLRRTRIVGTQVDLYFKLAQRLGDAPLCQKSLAQVVVHFRDDRAQAQDGSDWSNAPAPASTRPASSNALPRLFWAGPRLGSICTARAK